MPWLLVRHKVVDYAKWKPMFDGHSASRKALGTKGESLFRNADDPSEIVFLMEVDDLEKARQFVQAEARREEMERAGVSDQPDVYFLERVERVRE